METRIIIYDFILNELLHGISDAPLTDDFDLIGSGVIDSLGIMSLLVFIEEHFAVKISNNDLVPENFSSIRSITNLINQQK